MLKLLKVVKTIYSNQIPVGGSDVTLLSGIDTFVLFFWVFSKCCTTLNPFSVTKRTIHNKLQRVKRRFAMEIHQRMKLKRGGIT